LTYWLSCLLICTFILELTTFFMEYAIIMLYVLPHTWRGRSYFSREWNGPSTKQSTHLYSLLRLKMCVDLYLHSLICLHVIVFKQRDNLTFYLCVTYSRTLYHVLEVICFNLGSDTTEKCNKLFDQLSCIHFMYVKCRIVVLYLTTNILSVQGTAVIWQECVYR
jgi:hypothetical protein